MRVLLGGVTGGTLEKMCGGRDGATAERPWRCGCRKQWPLDRCKFQLFASSLRGFIVPCSCR